MEIATSSAPRSRKLGSVLLNVICALISVLALLFIVPAAFGLERYVIAGGSMTGSISRGSLVFEEKVPVADLRVGDVITYMPPADSSIPNLVTHRIHSIQQDTFRTKGDANPDIDPWTFKLTAGTQARAVAHVPLVGYAFLALQNRTARIAFVGVPSGLIALHSLGQLLMGLRRRRTDGKKNLAPAAAPVLIPAQARADHGRATTPRPARRPTRVGS